MKLLWNLQAGLVLWQTTGKGPPHENTPLGTMEWSSPFCLLLLWFGKVVSGSQALSGAELHKTPPNIRHKGVRLKLGGGERFNDYFKRKFLITIYVFGKALGWRHSLRIRAQAKVALYSEKALPKGFLWRQCFMSIWLFSHCKIM
jgi:hypothetical protein